MFLIYNTSMDIKERIDILSRELLKHQHLYYIAATPEVSDQEYDRMFDELLELEEKYPQYASENSPTRRVGSDLDNSFPEKEHHIPVLSLDKEYTVEALEKWINKTIKNADQPLSFVVEEKIDGASIVLYYKKGKLDAGLTRGNGLVGNDVTENIRTIKQIPLVTGETADFAVRGEIYIKKTEFETYNKTFDNKYANPRNLAAGSMRNIRSSVVAGVPLNIFCYEGFFTPAISNDHVLVLGRLKEDGFRMNNNMGYFCDDPEKLALVKEKLPDITYGGIEDLAAYVNRCLQQRDGLDHEIDGLVIKVNEIDVREALGYTSHHPRWAMALKFEAPTAQTRLTDIQVQVGRNGRVTPVGILEPVKIAGSTVARATLHNLEYIEMLELGFGDFVSISKRGDVIPAVEEVLEKSPENPSIFKFPTTCPFCESELQKDGAHHFCKNRMCPERRRRAIIYFAAKNQMDIDTLGEKTIALLFDKKYIEDIPDLYTFDYNQLLQEEGFKEKKIGNIKNSVEKSREQPFRKVLTALGFDGIGKSAVADLVKNGYNSVDKIMETAEKGDADVFVAIEGFAEITAQLLINHFTDPQNLELIRRLKELGLNMREDVPETAETMDPDQLPFSGQTWVITGSFEHFQPRTKAAEVITKGGGKVAGSVSSKTTHLLAGSAAGSKLKKAQKLGTVIVEEAEFLEMVKSSRQ